MIFALRDSRTRRSSSLLSDITSISVLAASRTWQIVTSGFFFRQTLRLARQKQMTDLREAQVPQDRRVFSHLEVAQSQFALFILQRPLDRPA